MDRKSILALFLIFLVLAMWEPYTNWLYPPEEQPVSFDFSDSLRTAQPDLQTTPQTNIPLSTPPVQPQPQTQAASNDTSLGSIIKTNLEEKKLIIDTPRYRGTISTKGGTIEEWILKKYEGPDGNPVSIVKNNNRGNLGLEFFSNEGFLIQLKDFDFLPEGFEFDTNEKVVQLKSAPRTFTLTANLGNQRFVRKKFTFSPNTLNVFVEVEFDRLQNTILNKDYTLKWGSGLRTSEENVQDDMMYSKSMALFGSDIETFDIGGNETFQTQSMQDGQVGWIATRNKYFISLIVPTSSKGIGYQFAGQNVAADALIGSKEYVTTLRMGYNPQSRILTETFLMYLGPIDYYTFKDINNTIEEDINLSSIVLDSWSMIRPISLLIYRLFNFLHSFIPNYGWVIIVFSLLLNSVLFPLNMKSIKSMKKMQELQPKLTELKEKYKKEPQKLQQAQIKMYKEMGVNPLGGCLPMLLQMPIFFALYPIFRTIELRGAEFIFWIKDLSVPDTIFLLPFSLPMYGNQFNLLTIIYAVSMFAQQKIMMKDPKQKMMVYIMPIMLLLFLNQLSSGFILYFTMFNLISIVQRFLLKDEDDAPVPAKAAKA